jgi:prepilin-type N-terminal cleavage/methylation domain-containing protein
VFNKKIIKLLKNKLSKKDFNKKNFNQNKVSKAFSLVEISIVILIIGILVVGVTQSSRLVGMSRLAVAKQLTQSSPVSSIRGLIGWYDSVSDKSFNAEDPDEGYRVLMWKDINPQEILKNNLVAADLETSPVFRSNCINLLPCIEFNGSRFLNNTINFSSTTQLSIFAIFRVNALGNSIQSIIASKGNRDQESSGFVYGIEQSPVEKLYYFASSSDGINAFSSDKIAAQKDYLSYFIDDGFIVNHFLSDQFSSSTSSVTGVKNLGFFTIGAWDDGSFTQELFNGSISELIIFNRALKIEERKEIEKYLTKKWKIKMFDPSTCGVNCPYANYCPLNVIGSSTNFVAPGSGTAQCDQNGYSGSVSYNCQAGNGSPSGSCSCASNYMLDGNYCKKSCNVAGVDGGTNVVSVLVGSGNLACTGTGYTGNATYSCASDGTFTLMSNCSPPLVP